VAINYRRQTEFQHVVINSAAGGTLAIVSALAQNYCAIYRLLLQAGGTTVITIQDTGANALSAPYSFAQGSVLLLDEQVNGDPWFQGSAVGLGLQLNVSIAVQVSGDIWFLQRP
jgi:hypothetical protein